MSGLSEEEGRALFEQIGRELGKPADDLTADDLLGWRATETARFDQVKAEHHEARRWSEAVAAAMEARGAVFAREVYDDVARELYGGHTALTRKWIAEVEALARGEWP